MKTKISHTINPNTGREIIIGGERFLSLIEHGYKYDEELNRLYDKPLPLGTTKYIPKSRILSPKYRPMIIGGSAYYELLRDNYRPVHGQWVKMSKEEAEAYDKDPNIENIYPDSDSNSDSEDSEDLDIDEFEYDKDGHAIFPF